VGQVACVCGGGGFRAAGKGFVSFENPYSVFHALRADLTFCSAEWGQPRGRGPKLVRIRDLNFSEGDIA